MLGNEAAAANSALLPLVSELVTLIDSPGAGASQRIRAVDRKSTELQQQLLLAEQSLDTLPGADLTESAQVAEYEALLKQRLENGARLKQRLENTPR